MELSFVIRLGSRARGAVLSSLVSGLALPTGSGLGLVWSRAAPCFPAPSLVLDRHSFGATGGHHTSAVRLSRGEDDHSRHCLLVQAEVSPRPGWLQHGALWDRLAMCAESALARHVVAKQHSAPLTECVPSRRAQESVAPGFPHQVKPGTSKTHLRSRSSYSRKTVPVFSHDAWRRAVYLLKAAGSVEGVRLILDTVGYLRTATRRDAVRA